MGKSTHASWFESLALWLAGTSKYSDPGRDGWAVSIITVLPVFMRKQCIGKGMESGRGLLKRRSVTGSNWHLAQLQQSLSETSGSQGHARFREKKLSYC